MGSRRRAAKIFLFFNDAEFALKLPFWIGEGLWWLVSRPFAHG
ncbi:MAG TPA: hypothetical protein VIH15_14690 [Casimicrobiaceae bacterium]|jgi:hypothetical protein